MQFILLKQNSYPQNKFQFTMRYCFLVCKYIIFVVGFDDVVAAAIQLPLNASTTTFSASTLCQDETPTAIVAPS